jgi:hypothetical protein
MVLFDHWFELKVELMPALADPARIFEQPRLPPIFFDHLHRINSLLSMEGGEFLDPGARVKDKISFRVDISKVALEV